MAEKNLNIKVTADANKASGVLNKITQELNKLGNNKAWEGANRLANSTSKIFKTVVNITKKAKAAIDECAKAYNTQAKAEKQLETAAKNNPYLNNSNVSQLKKFAGELQSISAVGDEELLPLMAQLASAGRTQVEIQDIMKATLDVSASGTMSLESAVKNLNKTYSGLSGQLGENIPEIKNLTKEQLQNGEAIAIIQEKYKGMAEEVTKSTGGMTKLKNSLGDLKEVLGEVPAKVKNAVGNTLSGFVDNIAEKMKMAKEEAQQFRDILEFKDVVKNGTDNLEKMQSSIQGLQTELEHLKDVKYAYFNSKEMEKKAKAEKEAVEKELEDIKKIPFQVEDLQIELEKLQNEANYYALTPGYEKEVELAKKRMKELDEQIKNSLEKYYREYDEAVKKAKEANVKYKKDLKEIETLEKEANTYKRSANAVFSGEEILNNEIEKLEKEIELGNEKLKLLKKTDALKKEQAEKDKLNNEASDAKQAFWKKIEEYNKEAELKRQIAKESNQAYSEEEEIAGRIKLMNDELYKLLQEQNGVTLENWEVQNAIIPLLQEQVTEYEEILALKEKSGNLEDVDEWSNAKDIIKNWNATEEDEEAVLQFQKETLQAYQAYLSEYGKNTEEEIKLEEDLKNAISKIDDAMIQERKQKFADTTNLVCDYINQFADISGQATDLLRQSNEAQTNEELNALSVQYTDGLISYEEYCAKKEEIDKKSAQKEYKLKMWEWQVSILQATANIAQGITSCLAQGFPLGLINGALIGASGALQIASLMASKPTPPAFASGGIVGATTGADNTIATVRTGEMILNAAQQKHLWELANGKNGNGAIVNMPITIENKASNEVNAKSQFSADGLRIVIDKMVDNSIRKGRYTQSLQIAENNRTGGKFL